MQGDAGHNDGTLVWMSVAEAATRLKCDPGTIRRRYNNPKYPYKYRRRETYGGGVEYGIPQEELNAIESPGNAAHAAGQHGAGTPSDAEHTPGAAVHAQAWSEDPIAEIKRLTTENECLQEDKAHLRELLRKQEEVRRTEIDDLRERIEQLRAEVKARNERIAVLENRITGLEMELRETLRHSEAKSTELAHRIADLVQEVERNRMRVIELAPLADEVPRLQEAVEEKEAILSRAEQELAEVERIVSGRVTGPIFRLLRSGRRFSWM